MKAINYEGYLTESKLGDVLREAYPESEGYIITPQWKILRYRVDYVVSKSGHDLYAFEFDGPTHFTSWACQVRDLKKNKALADRGISVIRIPYFVQLTDEVLSKYLPGIPVSSTVEFPHGFIDKKVVYPSDFNVQGVVLFWDTILELPNEVQEAIIGSSQGNGFDIRKTLHINLMR